MTNDLKLIIMKDRSILKKTDGSIEEFKEGANNLETKKRIEEIKRKLDNGFLTEIIKKVQENPSIDSGINETQASKIKSLVDSVTSEVGRALIGITTLQLCIKSICPDQSIRLHKGSNSSKSFSWQEGISMRSLDKNYITPILREYDLLRLNADGFMMTRSLAENYPYSKLYKASLRGGKNEWLEIVEGLENKELNPLSGLIHLISLLLNRSNTFIENSETCISKANIYIEKKPSYKDIFNLIKSFISTSNYSARVFEVAIHSAYQALDEMGYIDGYLKPLSQMRSANKKHGNIGDIEILETKNGFVIHESWDTKFGKPHLREEIEELSEKLKFHPDCKTAGFITDIEPIKTEEITKRINEIEEMYDCSIEILSFSDWFEKEIKKTLTADDYTVFTEKWLLAIVESFCQRRREKAPIDEPCENWIKELSETLTI